MARPPPRPDTAAASSPSPGCRNVCSSAAVVVPSATAAFLCLRTTVRSPCLKERRRTLKKVKKRALLLVNPKARRGGEAIDAVVGRLHRGGLDVTIEPFDALPEIARDIVRLRESADLIILCGGDGTIASGAHGGRRMRPAARHHSARHRQRPCPHAGHSDGPRPGGGRDPCRQYAQDRPRHRQRPRLLQRREHRAQRRPGAGAAIPS